MASTPTLEQQRVVDAGGGLVRVQSGAGTGKTTAVVHRIMRLINDGIPPDQILALSFTKAAANEVKNRVARDMHSGSMKRATTIHSEACRILRNYGARIDLDASNFQIVDTTDTAGLMKDCVDGLLEELEAKGRVGGLSLSSLEIDTKDKEAIVLLRRFVRERIDNWKERGSSVEQLEATKIANVSDLTGADIFSMMVYAKFQDRLHAQNLIEISDIIPMATKILEDNPDIRKKVAGVNVYVMVDEFQDVNKAQIRFIRQISSVFNNLTIVGDDDQSMYMFRGSMPSAMSLAHALLPEAAAKGITDVALTENWRSTNEILEVGNLMVDINPRGSMKVLTSDRHGSYPKVDTFDNEHIEANALAVRVKKLIQGGTPANEICVLSRLTRSLAIIDKVFLSHKIPHRMISGGTFVARQEVRDVLSWLRLVLNPESEIHFDRAAGSPPRGMGEKAIALIIREAQVNKIDCISALKRSIEFKTITGKARAGAVEMLDILNDLASMIEMSVPPDLILKEVIDRTRYLDWVAGKTAEPTEGVAAQADMFSTAKVLKPVKLSAAAKAKETQNSDRYRQVRDSLETLLDMTAEASNIMTLMDDLTLADEISSGIDKTPSVYVSSIHAAKGLEWDHVHLIGMYQGSLPFNRVESGPGMLLGMDNHWSEPLTGCLEEERRLAHVAITRAKKTASISYPLMAYQRPTEASELIELIREHIPAYKPKVRDYKPVMFGDQYDRPREPTPRTDMRF